MNNHNFMYTNGIQTAMLSFQAGSLFCSFLCDRIVLEPYGNSGAAFVLNRIGFDHSKPSNEGLIIFIAIES
jgi:hypothetical protein